MSEKRDDRTWKDFTTRYVYDALDVIHPEAAAVVDHAVTPTPLPTQHWRIAGESDTGSRISDFCVSLKSKDAGASEIVLAVEVESWHGPTIPERVYEAHYRLRDTYPDKRVEILVFVTGETQSANSYSEKCITTESIFKFQTYHISQIDETELRTGKYKFYLAILTGKLALKAQKDPIKRIKYAFEISELIQNDSRYTEQEKAYYTIFVYRLFHIDDNDIDPKAKEAFNMQVLSYSEIINDINDADAKLMAEIKGEIKGKLDGKLEIAKQMIDEKFSIKDIIRITHLTEDQIKPLM